MSSTPTPVIIERYATMRRISTADATARALAARRQQARRNGYRGPVTRAELAAQAAEVADREQVRTILHTA